MEGTEDISVPWPWCVHKWRPMQLWLLQPSDGREEPKPGQWMAQKPLTCGTPLMEVKVNILWLLIWKEVTQDDLKGHLPELCRITRGLGRTVRYWLVTAPARTVNPGHQHRGQAHSHWRGEFVTLWLSARGTLSQMGDNNMEDILGSTIADWESTWEKYTTGPQSEMHAPLRVCKPVHWGVGRKYSEHSQHT